MMGLGWETSTIEICGNGNRNENGNGKGMSHCGNTELGRKIEELSLVDLIKIGWAEDWLGGICEIMIHQ